MRGQLGLHSETRYQKLQEEGDGLMDNVLAIQAQGLQYGSPAPRYCWVDRVPACNPRSREADRRSSGQAAC